MYVQGLLQNLRFDKTHVLMQEERSKIFGKILSYFDLLGDIILKYVFYLWN